MPYSKREAFRFFCEHAGYSEPPGRAACALRLARAEQWARDNGVDYEWEYEECEWQGDEPLPEGCEHLMCTARLGKSFAHLGSIAVMPNDPYRRVVEAELALELMSEAEEADRRERQRTFVPRDEVAEGWA